MECQNAENQGDEDSEAQVQKPFLPKQKIMDKNITSYHSIATPDPSTAFHDVASKPSNGGGRLFGFILTILAGISFTAMSTMIKLLPRESSWQILFLRSLLQSLCMLPLMLRARTGMFGSGDFKIQWRVVVSGALGAFLLLAAIQAVTRIPLGDCTAIFFCSPSFTMIFSLFILKEPCGIWRLLIATCALVGVLFVCRPPGLFPDALFATGEQLRQTPASTNPIGLLWAFFLPVLGALMDILTRQACCIHFSVFVVWCGLAGLCISIGGLIYEGVLPYQDWLLEQWLLGLCISLVGIIGRVFFTVALSYITPNQVHIVLCLEVVFAYILQVTVFGDPIIWTSIVGTIIILTAVLAMMLEDEVQKILRSVKKSPPKALKT